MGRRIAVLLSAIAILCAFTALELSSIVPTTTAIAASTLAFFVMLSPSVLPRVRPGAVTSPWFRFVAWTGSFVLGVWSVLLIVSIPVELIRTVSDHPAWPYVPVTIALTVGALGLVTALRGPRVVDVVVPIEGLPPALRGFRFVQISDVHVGPTIRRPQVQRIVRIINTLGADVVVATGDIVDAPPDAVRDDLEPFAKIRSKHGVFYVTGNHEYFWGADAITTSLRQLGWTPLENESRRIPHGNTEVAVAGIVDPMGASVGARSPDVAAALRGTESAAVRILLSHRPDAVLAAEKLGCDLVFAGHTHAGQYFPFTLVIPFVHRFYRGLKRSARSWIYVNPGTGYWGPPNRFGVRAEITRLTLESGAAHGARTKAMQD